MTIDEIFRSFFEPGGPMYGHRGEFWDPDGYEPHEASCGLGGRREVKAKRERWEYLQEKKEKLRKDMFRFTDILRLDLGSIG